MQSHRIILLCILCLAAAPPTTSPAPALEIPHDRPVWEARRVEILQQWQRILGPLPDRPAPDTTIISTEELPDHTRLLLRYTNEPGATNDAYLLIPRTPGPHPAMVCLHPTSKTTFRDPVGLANREQVHHALHLVRRGYVCIAPRNYLWEVEGRSYQQAADATLKQGHFKTGMARMLYDAMRVVDVLIDRPEVDRARIGVIGHSLGGKEALILAAFDDRIRAAVSCEGGIGLSFSNWDADWYLGPQIKSPDFHHDNHELLALIAPRAFLLIGGESADGAKSEPFIDAAKPIWHLYNADDHLELVRHQGGHDFPKPGPERDHIYQWLDRQMNNEIIR